MPIHQKHRRKDDASVDETCSFFFAIPAYKAIARATA